MKEVTKLIERLTASTDPFQAIMETKHVYVKTFGSRWTNRILINEFICLRIAQAVGLTIPNGGICIINGNTDTDDVIDDIGYDEFIEGIAFYSEKIDSVNPSIKSINVVKNMVNKDEINYIILFDHLIYNIDRHKGNLLINYKNNSDGFIMYIIDHSHVFNLQHNWTSSGLQQLISNEDYKDKEILDLNYKEVYKYFYELGILNEKMLKVAAVNFKKIVTRELLNDIFEDIPKQWISNIEDLEKLKEYLLYRMNNIDYIVDMILNYENR